MRGRDAARSGSSPQPEHGELRRGEREQHAERIEAGQEDDVVGQRAGDDHERDRDPRRGQDRLRRDERAPVQAPEAPRQLPVLAERVGEPREAGDRGRRRRQQDERAGQPDVDAQRVAEPAGQRRLQRLDDPRERRPQPLVGRARSARSRPGTRRARRPRSAPSARRRARSRRRGCAAGSVPARGSPRRGWRPSRARCRRASRAAARTRGRTTRAHVASDAPGSADPARRAARAPGSRAAAAWRGRAPRLRCRRCGAATAARAGRPRWWRSRRPR